jgi:hypothetical protein
MFDAPMPVKCESLVEFGGRESISIGVSSARDQNSSVLEKCCRMLYASSSNQHSGDESYLTS